MPNINSVLNEQIRRLARREIRSQTAKTRKITARYRRDIAALKREINRISKAVIRVQKQAGRPMSIAAEPAAADAAGLRFRADGLRTHRAKLGISAADYGKLVGVSGLTIYHWEGGKAKPRRAQLAKLATVRGLGKREALTRLDGAEGGEPTVGKRRRRRGGPTAEDFVESLVSSGKAVTSLQINAAWSADGRPGKADNTLSRMCKIGRLHREKLLGQRGSRYFAGKAKKRR